MSRRAGGCFRLSRNYHTSTLHLTSTTSVVSEKLSKKPPARYPWTLLVSLQPGGKLIIEKQGDGGGPVVIELDAGEAVMLSCSGMMSNMVAPRTPTSTCASMSIGNPRVPAPLSFAWRFATLGMQVGTSCMLSKHLPLGTR